MMNLVKTFNTADIDPKFWDFILKSGFFVKDGVGKYYVGGFANEYDNAWDIDKAGYDLKDVEMAREFDNHLISLGAKKFEKVFIYHGTYR